MEKGGIWIATYVHEKLSTFIQKIYIFILGKHVATNAKTGLRVWHSDILDDVSLEIPNIHDIFENSLRSTHIH